MPVPALTRGSGRRAVWLLGPPPSAPLPQAFVSMGPVTGPSWCCDSGRQGMSLVGYAAGSRSTPGV